MELNKENMKKIMLLIVFAILVFTGLDRIEDVFGKLNVLLRIVFPFILGAAMAFILNVAMQFIERSLFGKFKTPEMKKKYPAVAKMARPVSLILSILSIVGIIFLVMFVVLPELASTVVGLGSSIEAFIPKAQIWLENIFENNEMLVDWIEGIEFDWRQMLESSVNFLKNGAQSVVISTVAVAKTLISTITNLFIGFVFACYILLQKEKLTVQVKKAFYAFLPKNKVEQLLEICSLSFKTFSNFVTGQCMEAVILGGMFFFTMTILRFPYPLLVGVLIAFTALIPIFGAFVGASVGTFLILVADPMKAIPFIILFLVLQQIEGNLIYPHVVGNSVGLPSIWVLVAVTVGGSLMGIVGMLIFIPLTSVLYTLFRRAVYRRLEEKKFMIFETHAHYDDEAFDKGREELLMSMQANGVETVINVGASLRGVADTEKLMKKYSFVYGAIGVHPDEVGNLTEEKIEWMRGLLDHPKAVAVGEIGLDYYWDKENHDIQKKWFVRQMDLAKETDLPIIVHSRDAAKDTLDIMKAERADNLRGVIHCYSYSKEHAREYMNMGYYLGIGGVVTFKNARKLKEVVEYAPLEYILLETDAPYLAPEPHRGERNCSVYLKYVAEEIARIKGVSYEEVVTITRDSAKKLFKI